MQKSYNRTNQYQLDDFSMNYLVYYTDMLLIIIIIQKMEKIENKQCSMFFKKRVSLPFRYLEIDAWWYYKGTSGGVANWIARPDIFPNGLPVFHRKIENIPIVAHNRHWAYDTTYQQNDSFLLDEKYGKALSEARQ